MKIFTLKLAAGETSAIITVGSFFRVVKATAELFIGLDAGPLMPAFQGMGYSADDTGARFESLRVYSATAQTVRIAAGLGRVEDTRIQIINGTVTGYVSSQETYFAAVARTLVPAANNTNGIRILGASLIASGGAYLLGTLVAKTTPPSTTYEGAAITKAMANSAGYPAAQGSHVCAMPLDFEAGMGIYVFQSGSGTVEYSLLYQLL